MQGARPALCLLAFLLAASLACSDGGDDLRTIIFTTRGGNEIELKVELADTPEKQQRGLMSREHLPQDQGMLFDFGGETRTGFWMKDTPIPLSIAFISGQGLILDIQDMQPFSTDLHRSPQPYLFAVEVSQGWFETNGISVGDAVQLPGIRPIED